MCLTGTVEIVDSCTIMPAVYLSIAGTELEFRNFSFVFNRVDCIKQFVNVHSIDYFLVCHFIHLQIFRGLRDQAFNNYNIADLLLSLSTCYVTLAGKPLKPCGLRVPVASKKSSNIFSSIETTDSCFVSTSSWRD